jgi:nitrogen fixation protein NifU and related proteins
MTPMVDSLYREIILDHYRNPRNKGTLDPHDYTYEDVNPLCGDEIRIDVRVADDKVSDIKFSGRGCAVSQASASILTEMVEGMSLDEVKALTKDDLLEELGIPVSPARLKCALLGLKVLKAGVYGVEHLDDEGL